jgi:hypothetical protein
MKTCPNCGCRVYKLGCVNCDEEAYIAEQEAMTAREEAEREAEEGFQSEQASFAGYPLTWGDEG